MTDQQRKQVLLKLLTQGLPNGYCDTIASLAEFIDLVDADYVYNPNFLLSYASELESHIEEFKCKFQLYSYVSRVINSRIPQLSSIIFDNSILYKIDSKHKELNGPNIERLELRWILNTAQLHVRIETNDRIVFSKKYVGKNYHVNDVLKAINSNSNKSRKHGNDETSGFCETIINELEDYIKTRKGGFTS